MSGMAEVLLATMRDHRVLWEIGIGDDCDTIDHILNDKAGE